MDFKQNTKQIGSIQIFCKAAELSSFTAAANALGITPAAVSRSVARVEEKLGVKLFARTTRRIRLTDDGQLYFEQCSEALRKIDDVEKMITGNLSAPKGTLKISVPTTYGYFRVLPVLTKFKALYPQVTLEIDISNRTIDFIEEGFDLAIRLGQPKDSRLVARRIEAATLGVYASKKYLEEHGTPQTLHDLKSHECIQFITPSTGKPLPWVFLDNGEEIEPAFNSSIRFSGDVLGCVGYALANGGLFQTYDFIAEQSQYQDLIEVLAPYRGRSRFFSIIYQQNRMLSAKVRVFIDLLVEECQLSMNKETH